MPKGRRGAHHLAMERHRGARETVALHGDSIAGILTSRDVQHGLHPARTRRSASYAGHCPARGIVLIFDEVITGFRLGFSGAQGRHGIKPDISVFAKGLGGGFPVAALGGRRDIMSLVADGTVSMAGTYSANGIAVAAANAALEELAQPGKHQALFARCERFDDELSRILKAHRLPAYVVGLGPVLQVWFAGHPIRNYRDAARYANHEMFRRWWKVCWNATSCSIQAPLKICSYRLRIRMPISTAP